ncbi:MAG: HEAT repeat domain-containing protein [Pirellulales bacterium]
MVRYFHKLVTLSLTCLMISTGFSQGTTPAEPPEDAKPIVDTPAVLVIKESNPQTATEIVRAAELMIDLGRDDLALAYLQLLVANAPDEDSWVAAHKKYGSGIFIRFQSLASLQPTGAEVAQSALQAISDYAHNSKRIDGLIQQLGSDVVLERQKAKAELSRAQQFAVNPLLKALGDPAQATQHATINQLLVSLGEYSEAPLLAALDTENNAQKANVIRLLTQLRSHSAVSLLVGPVVAEDSSDEVKKAAATALIELIGSVPSNNEVQAYLLKRIEAYTAGTPMLEEDDEGKVRLWTWDQKSQQAVGNYIPSEDASLLIAARLAEDLYQLDTSNAEYRRLYLTTALQSVKYLGGIDQPIIDTPEAKIALGLGFEYIEDLLRYTMGKPNFLAATLAACELLGTADASILEGSGGQPRALARALRHGHYLVRVAAADAIVKIDPQQPYPGSSALSETLVYLASATGQRVVVIGEPHLERAESLAALFYQLGFSPIVTRGGRPLFQAAYSTADVEMILVSDGVDYPVALESLQILRRDRRTADLPIGLLSRIENLERFELRTSDDRLTIPMVRPFDADGLTIRIQQLLESQGRYLVSAETRLANAKNAMRTLATLSTDQEKYGFYRLLEREDELLPMLQLSETTLLAASLAGQLGTPNAQLALVNLASESGRVLEHRQACVLAFQTAVEKRGLMLTKANILKQYTRYNASETLDKQSQKVLSDILDAIEKPTKGVRLDQPALTE